MMQSVQINAQVNSKIEESVRNVQPKTENKISKSFSEFLKEADSKNKSIKHFDSEYKVSDSKGLNSKELNSNEFNSKKLQNSESISSEKVREESLESEENLSKKSIQTEKDKAQEENTAELCNNDSSEESLELASMNQIAQESSSPKQDFKILVDNDENLEEVDIGISRAEKKDNNLYELASNSKELENFEKESLDLLKAQENISAGKETLAAAEDVQEKTLATEFNLSANADKIIASEDLESSESKNNSKIRVIDQRQSLRSVSVQKSGEKNAELNADKLDAKNNVNLTKGMEAATKEVPVNAAEKNALNMEISLDSNSILLATQNASASSDQSASALGSQFQAMLANQIQYSAPEFVKAGNILLRDGGSGTINLIMHPESLGNVKISLEVSDKIIAGQITVASKEAYNAFKESIGTLQNAFTENGFESAGFNLSWTGSERQNGNFNGQDFQNEFRMAQGERTYGSLSDESLSDLPASYIDSGDYSVNIVA